MNKVLLWKKSDCYEVIRGSVYAHSCLKIPGNMFKYRHKIQIHGMHHRKVYDINLYNKSIYLVHCIITFPLFGLPQPRYFNK